MHALVTYSVPSLFSLRMLQANAHAARTLVCPTPAGVNMGLLSTLIRRDGPLRAQEHLDWLAPLGVAWSPPQRLAVTAVTVRIWKDTAGETLTSSVGMREYAHLPGTCGLALLDVPDERQADLEYALARLRALGNAESLIQPSAPARWADGVPPDFVILTDDDGGRGGYVCVLDDLGSAPSFERLSVYRPVGRGNLPRLGEERRRLLIRLPLRVARRSTDGYVVERTQ